MNKYIIAFDVGGSYIKAAILNHQGNVIPNSIAIFPSKAKELKEEIINHFIYIIQEQMKRFTDDFQLNGIGFAFPGPFDYKNGISYIQGIDKFDSLYGVNIREELMRRIKQVATIHCKVASEFLIVFENDANLFALGEHKSGKGQNFNKVLYLTVGTGAGSAFMENACLIKNDPRVPKNGWIYQDSYGDSIVDDYISKRGVLNLAEELSLKIEDDEVKTIAELAQKHHKGAKEVFHQFGLNIGSVLNPYIKSFAPEAIIIGGQISKSFHLFKDGIYETLGSEKVKVDVTNNTSNSTFIGIADLIDRSKNDQ